MLHFALVLHAHLPWVRQVEPFGATERWFHEALWECYLPLIQLLDELAEHDVPVLVSVSVSPPLAAMLRDEELALRFEQHLDTLIEVNAQQGRLRPELGDVVEHYDVRLHAARESWQRCGGDLLGALRDHHREGRLELLTSAASHAYLPGLAVLPGAAEAQLEIGRTSFRTLTGVETDGVWLPECGYDERVDLAIAASDYQHTIVDAHAIAFASPRVPPGSAVVSTNGVICLPRDRASARLVWSRSEGYPGHPHYRDFYRDVGFDRPASELGPLGAETMTGLKYHRITAHGGTHKDPYEPQVAAAQAEAHAADFVGRLEQRSRAGESLVLAAFDAELFGHWWFEGPRFLGTLLRAVAASEVLSPTSPSRLARSRLPLTQPAASSWGRGGFGQVWLSERSAPWWRSIHKAHRSVAHAVGRSAPGRLRGRALDQAVRELMLLQASDWLFMIDGQSEAAYGRERLQLHLGRAETFAQIATDEREPTEAERRLLEAPAQGFLSELSGEALWGALQRG